MAVTEQQSHDSDNDGSSIEAQSNTQDREQLDSPFALHGSGPITVVERDGGFTTTTVKDMDVRFDVSSVDVFKELFDTQYEYDGPQNRDQKRSVVETLFRESDANTSEWSLTSGQVDEWTLTINGTPTAYRNVCEHIDVSSGQPSQLYHFLQDCVKYWLFGESASIAYVAEAQRLEMSDNSNVQHVIVNDLLTEKGRIEVERESDT